MNDIPIHRRCICTELMNGVPDATFNPACPIHGVPLPGEPGYEEWKKERCKKGAIPTPEVDALDNKFAREGSDNGPTAYKPMRDLARSLERCLSVAMGALMELKYNRAARAALARIEAMKGKQ